MEARWLAATGLLLSGLAVGPALLALLLFNEPPSLRAQVTTYRVFAVLASGAVALAPVSGVATALGRRHRRWLPATLLLLVFPTMLMAGAAAYLALRLWG